MGGISSTVFRGTFDVHHHIHNCDCYRNYHGYKNIVGGLH